MIVTLGLPIPKELLDRAERIWEKTDKPVVETLVEWMVAGAPK